MGAGRTPAVRRPASTSGLLEAAKLAGPRAPIRWETDSRSPTPAVGSRKRTAHYLTRKDPGFRGYLSSTRIRPRPKGPRRRSSAPRRRDTGSVPRCRPHNGADTQALSRSGPCASSPIAYRPRGPRRDPPSHSPTQMMRTSPHDTMTLF